MSLDYSLRFDTDDLWGFKKTCDALGEKVALKAAKKGAQKGANVVGREIRRSAPKASGQLKKGFRKKKEKSKLRGKFVYDYAMDSAKNDIFQKPIKNPGALGGKSPHAYYPSSIEYGFLAKAPGSGYYFVPGKKYTTQKVEGTHFTREAAERAEPAAYDEMWRVFNEEVDKEWQK